MAAERRAQRWSAAATGVALVAVLVVAVLVRLRLGHEIPVQCLTGSACPDCGFYAEAVLRAAQGRTPGLAPPYTGLVALLGTGPDAFRHAIGINGGMLVVGAVAAGLGGGLLVEGPARPFAALAAGLGAVLLHPLFVLHQWMRPDAAGAGLMALTAAVGIWCARSATVGRSLIWGLSLGLLIGVREHGVAMAGGAIFAVSLMRPLRPAPLRLLALLCGIAVFALVPRFGWVWADPDRGVSMVAKVLLPLRDAAAVAEGQVGAGKLEQWGPAAPTTPREVFALSVLNLGPVFPWAAACLAVPVLLLVRGRNQAMAVLCAVGPVVAGFVVKTLMHHMLAMVPLIALVSIGGLTGVADAALGRLPDRRFRWLAVLVPVGALVALRAHHERTFEARLTWEEGYVWRDCTHDDGTQAAVAALQSELQPGDTVYTDSAWQAKAVLAVGAPLGPPFPGVWGSDTAFGPGLLLCHQGAPLGLEPIGEPLFEDGTRLYRLPHEMGPLPLIPPGR